MQAEETTNVLQPSDQHPIDAPQIRYRFVDDGAVASSELYENDGVFNLKVCLNMPEFICICNGFHQIIIGSLVTRQAHPNLSQSSIFHFQLPSDLKFIDIVFGSYHCVSLSTQMNTQLDSIEIPDGIISSSK